MSKVLVPPADAFRLSFTPKPADIDANGHVNNVVYLAWAQDLAIAHWESRVDAARRAPFTWIARRHEIDYRRELRPGEIATGRTWIGELKGPRFERLVRIDGPDGEMCAQSRTDWVLVDVASKRPVRIPDWVTAIFTPAPGPSAPD